MLPIFFLKVITLKGASGSIASFLPLADPQVSTHSYKSDLGSW